jgi:hypothetical protein
MTVSSFILLAFANDVANDRRYLRSLQEESKTIGNALMPAVEKGLLAPPVSIFNATVGDVMGAFQQPFHREKIRIFHFGGHADGSQLIFEDEAGGPAGAKARNLAAYLGQQESLVLVFLNGCCTEGQVRRLRETGIKAVVATTSDIDDKMAADFAEAFYKELATCRLRQAFDRASVAVALRWSHQPGAIFRDVASQSLGQSDESRFPWILDCDEKYARWRLAWEMPGRPRWEALIILALAAVAALVVTMALSARTRRAVCGMPGGVSVCAALGLSAETRRAETLAPPQQKRYPLIINPQYVRPFSTEDEAKKDALTQGQQDAETLCEPHLWLGKVELADVQPRVWNCVNMHGGFACGFKGDAVCSVRARIPSDAER